MRFITYVHTMYSSVRYKGYLWKVHKHLAETEEQAKDRAWYIATQLGDAEGMTIEERESRSRAWANVKYSGMDYNNK